MSYGIAIKNEFDENLVDVTEGLTYYHKSSGTCLDIMDASSVYYNTPSSTWVGYFPFCSAQGSMANGFHFPYHNLSQSQAPHSLFILLMNWAMPSWGVITHENAGGSVQADVPTAVSTNKDDIVFFKIPTEGVMSLQTIWMPFTGVDSSSRTIDVGLHAICTPDYRYAGGKLKYKVVSTDLPASSGSYGLKVFSPSGAVNFDTTREVASFVDHINVTAAQAEDIILNNTSLTFTLRTAITNMWMASAGGGGGSYRTVYNNTRATSYVLRIRQTAATTVVVDRAVLTPTSSSWAVAVRDNYENMQILCADYGV